jgi:hypothetical protein
LAPELWNRIKNDVALVDEVVPKKSSASPNSSADASPKATPTPTTVDKFKTQTAAENPCATK